jgi:hypothetical protein
VSIPVALDNIRLRGCDRWAHTEYSLGYHTALLEKHTGLKGGAPGFFRRAYDEFGLDFLWSTNDGPVEWSRKGRVTDMGHASYAADGSDQRAPQRCPFQAEEEVWAFDAVEEYGLPDFDELVCYYEKSIADARREFPDQLLTGGCYRTIVSGAIASFGWGKARGDIDRTLERLAGCKGAIFAVGNHLPPNIPEAMMEQYFEYLLPRLKK